jgi:hypothetical protein
MLGNSPPRRCRAIIFGKGRFELPLFSVSPLKFFQRLRGFDPSSKANVKSAFACVLLVLVGLLFVLAQTCGVIPQIPASPTAVLGRAEVLPAQRSAPPSNQKPDLWFVDSLVNVVPGDLPGTNRLSAPEFFGARNQHVSLQLAVRSTEPLAKVTAEVHPLEGPDCFVISDVQVQRVGYVQFDLHTPDTPADELVGTVPGLFPDPLMDLPFEMDADKTYALWVTIHIPPDAPPGIYEGNVIVRSRGRHVGSAPYSLKVFAASVPEERSVKLSAWFWLDGEQTMQYYGIPAFSKDWWRLVDNTARVLGAHRQNVIFTYPQQLVRPYLDNGQVRYDFGNFDRWVQCFKDRGVIGFIEGSFLLERLDSWASPPQAWVFQAEGEGVQLRWLPAEDPRVEDFLTGFLPLLYAHLKEKGWEKIYLQHILDEPHGNDITVYPRFAEMVRRFMPGIRTIEAIDPWNGIPDVLQTGIDIWVPLLGRFDDQMEMLRERIATGNEVWYYNCSFPRGRYPNRFIDYPLIKTRIQLWLDSANNFGGFLFYGGNDWWPDPMSGTGEVAVHPAGELFIVYPDRANKSVLSSIRYEALRDGAEDYELMRLLRAQDRIAAERLVSLAVHSFTDYVRDPALFREIERSLLEALSD